MSTRSLSKSLSAASMVALALSAGLPPLGQQSRIQERPNVAGERLRPPKPKPKRREKTPFDLARIAKAQAKRDRRGLRDSRNLANGCQRQTAAPRSIAELAEDRLYQRQEMEDADERAGLE